jgi:pyruvate dehydrogenase (quinone)
VNVCEVIVDLLARNGVKRIYGVAGDALNPFTDALRRDGRIAWIGVKHEGDGALAAYAESAVSGGLGVCAGTLGLLGLEGDHAQFDNWMEEFQANL